MRSKEIFNGILAVAFAAGCTRSASTQPAIDAQANLAVATSTATASPTASETATTTATPDLSSQATIDALSAKVGILEALATPATATATKTSTPTAEPLSGIADCYPLTKGQEFSSASVNIPNDMRDAANTLSADLTISNTQSVVDMQCWVLKMVQGYNDGTLQVGDITTFEKIGELLGVPATDLAQTNALKLDIFGLADVRQGQESKVGAVGIVTSADNLSETIVRLSAQLAAGARSMMGDGASVETPDSIARQIASDYALENLWYPGIDPRKADEIFKMCLTVRSPLLTGTRQDQPESNVFAQWRSSTDLGQEHLTGNIYELSYKDGMFFVLHLVNDEDLQKIEEILKDSNPEHHLGIAKVADGLSAVFATFDLRNEIPNSQAVLDAADTEKIGSGGGLLECGPGNFVPATTGTRPPINTHSAPTGTRPADTQPTPTGTRPVPTGTGPVETQPFPTVTSPVSTVTQGAAITSQPLIETATDVNTIPAATVTAVATDTNTPIPVEEPSETPVPPTPLPASSTPSR